MKNYIIDYLIKIINNKYHYDEIKTSEIRYGLESIYLTITKSIVIFLIAILLGIIKELLIFLVFFNIIRFTAFGLHAKNSITCLIYSSLIFLLLPFISKYIIINKIIKIISFLVLIILIYIYSPADTKKRPIISLKRRKVYKYISVIISIIYMIVSLNINNNLISNLLLFALFLETILINPISYKLFNQSYNNYKTYKA